MSGAAYKLGSKLLQNHMNPLHSCFANLNPSESLNAFGDSVDQFAATILQSQDDAFIAAINEGTADSNTVVTRYAALLRGEGLLPSSSAIDLPPGALILSPEHSSIVIAPQDVRFARDAQQALTILQTTPMTRGGLPRLAEFIAPSTTNVGDLTVRTSTFGAFLLHGGQVLAEQNLLNIFAKAVNSVEDKIAYMDTWNLYVADLIGRAETVRSSMSSMLAREQQMLKLRGGKDDDPVVMNLSFYQRTFAPLADIVSVAHKAFTDNRPIESSIEGGFVFTQAAKIGNIAASPTMFLGVEAGSEDFSSDMPLTHSDIRMIMDAGGLGIFSNMVDHLRMTYQHDAHITPYIKIGLSSKEPSFEMRGEMPAVRFLVDAILYNAMLSTGNKPYEVAFSFDRVIGAINVSYERPQPSSLRKTLHDIANRWSFGGNLEFDHVAAGIAGVSIMGASPDGSFDNIGGDAADSSSKLSSGSSMSSSGLLRAPFARLSSASGAISFG